LAQVVRNQLKVLTQSFQLLLQLQVAVVVFIIKRYLTQVVQAAAVVVMTLF
jgi:hypothetical protein